MESDTCDIAGMPLEGKKRSGVCRANVVELDIVVASRGEKAFIRGDAEAVDLGVRMLDCAGADAAEGLPEANSMVVAS